MLEALPTWAQILGANHNQTLVIIGLVVALAALLLRALPRGEREERVVQPPSKARLSFWRRVAVEMDRAESCTRYGSFLDRLNGWPAVGVLFAMPVATWAIYAVVPDLSAPVLYAAFVLMAATLGSHAFRPQPGLELHVLLMHLLTGVLVWGLFDGGWAVGFLMLVLLLAQAVARSRQGTAPRWSRPTQQRPPVPLKPEQVMALAGVGVVIGMVLLAQWIPNLRVFAALPLVLAFPWILSSLIARGRSFQAPPLVASGFFLPIAPVAWFVRVACDWLAHLVAPSAVAGVRPTTPEPEPEGGLGVVLLFFAGRVAPVVLLCAGQLLLWRTARAVQEQAVVPIHLFLVGAILLHCVAVAPVGLEMKRVSLQWAADYLIGHGMVAARAIARNFSVLSLLVLPLLASSVLSGSWRQSVWPWLYFVALIAGVVATWSNQPAAEPTQETKAFRAAGGR